MDGDEIANRIDASFFGDPGHGPVGPQRRTALLRTDTSGFSELDSFGGHNQPLRLALTLPSPEGVLVQGTTRHLTFAGLEPATFDPDAGSICSRESLVGAEWEGSDAGRVDGARAAIAVRRPVVCQRGARGLH